MILTKISPQNTLKIPDEFRRTLPAGEEVAVAMDAQGRLVVTPLEKIRSQLMETFGMWADRTDIPSDGVDYVNEIRNTHRTNGGNAHR